MLEKEPPHALNKEFLIKRSKLLFVALMDAAMRHREAFWREELENANLAVPTPDHIKVNQITRKQRRHLDRWKDKVSKQIKTHKTQETKAFNSMAYQMIDHYAKAGTEATQARYDNLVALLSGMTERIFETKNPVELMVVIDMYHAGYFDEVLKAAKGIGSEQEKSKC